MNQKDLHVIGKEIISTAQQALLIMEKNKF